MARVGKDNAKDNSSDREGTEIVMVPLLLEALEKEPEDDNKEIYHFEV